MSCSDYLMTMRSIADELAFIGSPVSDDDLAMYILGGLGPEFNSFVVAATTASRRDGFSLPDLQAGLLSHENLLQTQISSSSSLPSASNLKALFTANQRPRNSNPKPANQHYPNPNSNQRPPYNPNFHYNRPRPNYQNTNRPTGPRPNYQPNNRPTGPPLLPTPPGPNQFNSPNRAPAPHTPTAYCQI